MVKLSEIYLSKQKRNARYKELSAQGMRLIRSRTLNQRIHPQYIKDFEGPEKFETDIGNAYYRMRFAVLYVVEQI